MHWYSQWVFDVYPTEKVIIYNVCVRSDFVPTSILWDKKGGVSLSMDMARASVWNSQMPGFTLVDLRQFA